MMLELSAQAQHRRDTIRAHVLDQAPAIAHRRKRKKITLGTLGASALLGIVVLSMTLRPAPHPTSPATPRVTIETVTTDPTIIKRLAFQAQSNPHVERISDTTLLQTLGSLGIQTGLIQHDGKVLLTRDVVASHAPTDQTTES
jgi:hypothetical protein